VNRRGCLIAALVIGLVVVVIPAILLLTASGGGSSRPPGSHAGRPQAPVPGTAPNTSPARPAPTEVATGASVNLLFNAQGLPSDLINRELGALAATGARVARSDALWEAGEPQPPRGGVHTYDWAFDDLLVGALAQAGLTWLPILDYTAPWDQSIPDQDHSPPRDPAAYADWAAALAHRYGPRGKFWSAHPGLHPLPVQTFEVWNEPDSGAFWTPGPNAAAYADLYAAARGAIDAVDPGARVIVGGLTDTVHFLPAMLAAHPSLRGHIDGVAIHPYGRPRVVLSRILAARSTLNVLGLSSVPLDVTEFGWTTQPRGGLDYVSATRRPAYIRRTMGVLAAHACNLGSVVLYTWFSPRANPADSQQWYGLNGGGDADSAAFTAGVRALNASRASRPCAG
jgi:hypothetical protein